MIAAAGVIVSGGPPAAVAQQPATHTVTIEGERFEPEVLTVKPGDSIVWVNKDPFAHTATSRSGGFDSQEIQPEKSWKYTAAKTGEFTYQCMIHETMTATLRVK